MLRAEGCSGLELPHQAPINLLDAQLVCEAVRRLRPEAVVHLAAQSSVPEAFANPAQTFDANLIGTQNLLAALKANGFKGRFLFVSTAEVYGQSLNETLPTPEDAPLLPLNPYEIGRAHV
jgi:GDP-4-dehydro-6-deoxy-D-mannose reductase